MLLWVSQVPVVIAWGEKDPWEPIVLGKAYGAFDTVEEFIVLPNVGHCPQVCFISGLNPHAVYIIVNLMDFAIFAPIGF
jgi:hypothetical protein